LDLRNILNQTAFLGDQFALAALGTNGDDTFDYSATEFASRNLYINGGVGNDNLSGNNGNDFFDGGAGVDTLTGGGGNDTFFYANADELLALLDINMPGKGGAVVDLVSGGDGIDIVQVDAPLNLIPIYSLARITGVEVLRQGLAGDSTVVTLTNDASLGSIRTIDLSASNAGNTININELTVDVSLIGGSGSDFIFGGSGSDGLTGNSGSDNLDGGAGVDTYFVGNNDDAEDTVAESGSAVTLTSPGTFGGFDLVEQFNKGQDILKFNGNSGSGKQLAGTYNSNDKTFTLGSANSGNDVIVFTDSNNDSLLSAGENAIVLVGLAAAGQVVDLNGDTSGTGYAAGMYPLMP
jgi:Ca2+-binding RTX toxin-like protein